MQQNFFWCGNVILLHHLLDSPVKPEYTIKLINESIVGRQYTYEVTIDDARYFYRFTLSSNTQCNGSFFIEGDTWKSNVMSFTRPYNYMHVYETTIDYHDLCFFGNMCVMNMYIKSGRKNSITTISIQEKRSSYVVRPVRLPIISNKDMFTPTAIRNIFAISGAIDQFKQVVNDIVSYEGNAISLVSYTDNPIQVIGVETYSGFFNKTSVLQCVNSFYHQRYEFKTLGKNTWSVIEYVDGVQSEVVKRSYTCKIEGSMIFIPSTNLKFSYQVDNGSVIFRKT